MPKFYSGIGPRKTPTDVQNVMTEIARQLSPTGWILRSGFSNGADRAFGRGAVNQNIFLPWEGFNGGYSNGIDKAVLEITAQQIEIAQRHHPCWDKCSADAMKLLCRNVPVLLGENLDDPSECVITWSPTAQFSGGTSHAIRIANTYGIPVFNIGLASDQNDLCQFLLDSENRSSNPPFRKAA